MLRVPGLIIAVLAGSIATRGAAAPDLIGTRLDGVRTGPYAVGFELITGLDAAGRTSATDGGTRLGLAVWYPAQNAGRAAPAVTQLEYRLLQFERPGTSQERAFIDEQVDQMVNMRHVGIVALTKEQARASLSTRGIAVRNTPPVARRFPVALVFGGQYYLSTTAEVLASHGFLVAAPFRLFPRSEDGTPNDFTVSVENDLRDADWAIARIRAHANADAAHISVIGHGGGGQRAMIFGMRHPDVSAVVTIDAGNFSARSESWKIRSYDTALMRAPYLFLATAATRAQQDHFDDFLRMDRAERFEVIFQHPDLKHHDLSDLGRAVTAPMRLRGDALGSVDEAFATLQDVVVRFLQTFGSSATRNADDLDRWLHTRLAASRYRYARFKSASR